MSDLRKLCMKLKDSLPPYKCPVETCDRILKSFTGAKIHIYKFHNRRISVFDKKKTHLNCSATGTNDSLNPNRTIDYAEDVFKLYLDGQLCKLNVNDCLELIDEEWKKDSCALSIWNSEAKCLSSSDDLAACVNNTKKSQNTSVRLPEPSFCIRENYDVRTMPVRSSTYYKYDEDTSDDISKEVEYDMDDEDVAWLSLVNKKRKHVDLGEVNEDVFELLMDRLEKESFYHCQAIAEETLASIDENAVCCICNDGDCDDSNVIIFCDECNLPVHQECYGVPFIPQGQWLCRPCSHSPSMSVDCVLCPNKNGAFKPTDDGRWAHVICALWIPEASFSDPNFLEPIDSLQNIPRARWKLCCYICKERNSGACIQCKKISCYAAFHVTCAQNAGLFMEMKAVKKGNAANGSFEIIKTAFCMSHTPDTTSVKGCEEQDTENSLDNGLEGSKAMQPQTLTELCISVTSVPNLSPQMLARKMKNLSIHLDQNFIERIVAFWKLKRQSRGGAPLLRRLQLTVCPKQKQESVIDDLSLEEREMHQLIRLRQDFERVRLLLEMIQKREKMKQKLIQIQKLETSLRLQPFVMLLLRTLEKIQSQDVNNIFAEPVNTDIVPDYLEFIKNPMDFSTMRKKAQTGQYNSFEDFEADFNLIINNCLIYNAKDTIYYQIAMEMKRESTPTLQKAKEGAARSDLNVYTRFTLTNEKSLEMKGANHVNNYMQARLRKKCRHQKNYTSNHYPLIPENSCTRAFPRNAKKLCKIISRIGSDESDEENGMQNSSINYHQLQRVAHRKVMKNHVKLEICSPKKNVVFKPPSRQLRSSGTQMPMSSPHSKVPRNLLTFSTCSPHKFSVWADSKDSCEFTIEDAYLISNDVPLYPEPDKFVSGQSFSPRRRHLRK